MKTIRWIVAILGISIALSVSISNAVSAHVLITDDTNTRGAVLHIVPDDDPIAGQPATLYFDGQDGMVTQDSVVRMTVQAQDGATDTVVMKKKASTATVDYTFPTQGVYKMNITVNRDGRVSSFQHTQRVSRGIVGAALVPVDTAWAKVVVIGGIVSMCVLGIMVFNRRKAIARQSTF